MSRNITFTNLLDSDKGKRFLDALIKPFESNRNEAFRRWYDQTGEHTEIYPSQGLLTTPFDNLSFIGKTMMSDEELWETLRMRRYILEILNHPDRLKAREAIQKQAFVPPPLIKSDVMDYSVDSGLALSISDVGSIVTGTDKSRISRRELLKRGPFIKLGKWARIPFSSGAMPDVFGSPAALATMAMCHAMAGIPRNGYFSELKRQVDLAAATIEWLEGEEILQGRDDAKELATIWRQNLVGVVETEMKAGMERVDALYEVGIRSFRVYSPEPGKDAQAMVRALRKEYGDKIEIFAGQVASLDQGLQIQEAGADGLFVGIGGGGRCITAVRSGSVVDWPNLLWIMRGEVTIPIVVEGGASDHIGSTLLLGGSGVGVTRSAAGGTIESPGGLMYLVNKEGEWFKPYGGEASARTKYLDGKMLAMNLPAFVEGETTKAIKSYVPYVRATIAENMYLKIEDLILSLVFRGARSITELQGINPSPLRRLTNNGVFQQNVH